MAMWSRYPHLTLVITATVLTLGAAQGGDTPPVQLKYLGTAGWEITDGKTVVLIDPFLSRPRMAISQLRDKQREHQRVYAEFLNGDLGRVIDYTRFTGERYQSPVSDILLHLTLHGTHHRGQMAINVSGKGLKPINTDFIQFCLLNRL